MLGTIEICGPGRMQPTCFALIVADALGEARRECPRQAQVPASAEGRRGRRAPRLRMNYLRESSFDLRLGVHARL